MSLFQQTLKTAMNCIEENNFNKAKKILDDHISKEHEFTSNFNSLLGHLHQYESSLRYVAGELRRIKDTKDPVSDMLKNRLINSLVLAQDSLTAAKNRMEKVSKER